MACLKIEGVGGAPFVGRETYGDLKMKKEIAEDTITDGPIDLQESYLESLSFWQLCSEQVEKEVRKTKKAIKKVRADNIEEETLYGENHVLHG
jgi:hypothetical protein